MITIGSNGRKIAYGIKHYNLDTEADLAVLQTKNEPMGSTCFVISTSKYYMLNSGKKWVEITPFGQMIASGGNGNPGEDNDEDNDNNVTPGDDIIYDGGTI